MKKKILAMLLAALMILPFGILTSIEISAEKVSIPARPTVTATAKSYIAAKNTTASGAASANTNDGLSADKPKETWGDNTSGAGAISIVKNGGTIVVVGKGYMGSPFTVENNGTILITAKDGANDYRDYKYYNDTETSNGTQRGCYMANAPIVFAGNVIFDDISLLSRDFTFSFTVKSGKSIVIGDGVNFANMDKIYKNNRSLLPTLNLEEGSYAFLDTLGFYAYGGKGTIVVGDAVKSQVNENTFKGFLGKVVDSQGNVLVTPAKAALAAEPTLTNTTDVGFIAHGSTAQVNGSSVSASSSNAGTTPEKPKNAWGFAGGTGVVSLIENGGTIVSHGKGFISTTHSFEKHPSAVLITAKYGGTDYRNGDIAGTQRGTLLLGDSSITVHFHGDYIIDDIDVYARGAAASVMSVEAEGRLVIGDGAQILRHTAENSVAPALYVNAGGVAYLHAGGFRDYVGGGTIVLDRALVENGTFKEEMFANFGGAVLYADGSEVFAEQAPVQPEQPGQTPDTGDTVYAAALTALIALIGCAVVLKKKEI